MLTAVTSKRSMLNKVLPFYPLQGCFTFWYIVGRCILYPSHKINSEFNQFFFFGQLRNNFFFICAVEFQILFLIKRFEGLPLRQWFESNWKLLEQRNAQIKAKIATVRSRSIYMKPKFTLRPPGRRFYIEETGRCLGDRFREHLRSPRLRTRLRSHYWTPFCFPGHITQDIVVFVIRSAFRDATGRHSFEARMISDIAPYTLTVSKWSLLSYKVSVVNDAIFVFIWVLRCTHNFQLLSDH